MRNKISIVFLVAAFGSAVLAPHAEAVPTVPATGLKVRITESGKISLSADGVGSNDPAGATVQVEKPNAGATVRSAFFACASNFNRVINDGDVSLDGNPITWAASVQNNAGDLLTFFNNVFANVTAIVKPRVDTAVPGLVDFSQIEVNSASIDGCALYVVFDDPSQTTDNTVFILFGGQNTNGDNFPVTIATPLAGSDRAEMGLGISFSFQGSEMFSEIDVNSVPLTRSAGGQDDGAAAGGDGPLLTVGGVGDSTVNPADPNAPPAGDPRIDDELYDLRPFVGPSDTNIFVQTLNPSDDDNIFAGHIFVTKPASPAPNDPPVASSVSISGTPQVGQVLTGSYLYSDVDGDDEGTSTFAWLRGTVPIDGATAQSYALVAGDEGAMITFRVTPVAVSGPSPGLAINSAAVGPVTPAPDPRTPPTASSVFISGTPRVGEVLTGSYLYSDVDSDDEGTSTFRWLRGTVPIDGATAQSYALVAADEGALIRFEVTPIAQSGPSPGLAVASNPLGPVTPAPNPPTPPTASGVFISGTSRVGQVLTGSYTYGDVEGDLEAASTFRWLRDNVVIAGATARSYALVAADEGALIRFEVTPVAQSGPSPGLAVTSTAVGPVTPDPHATTPPTASSVFISGAPQVGQVLTGNYTYADAEGDLQGASTFRWLRDNVAIAGATAQSYALVAADEGALIRFEVTPVAQSGPSPGLAVTSAAVGPVTPTLGRDRDDGRPSECSGSQCRVRLACNAVGISCTARVTLFAFVPRARLSDRSAAQVVRSRIRFAAAVVNVPPGETRTVRLRVTPRGKRIVNSGTRRVLRGVLEIRNSAGGIQNTPIRIRIRVRR